MGLLGRLHNTYSNQLETSYHNYSQPYLQTSISIISHNPVTTCWSKFILRYGHEHVHGGTIAKVRKNCPKMKHFSPRHRKEVAGLWRNQVQGHHLNEGFSSKFHLNNFWPPFLTGIHTTNTQNMGKLGMICPGICCLLPKQANASWIHHQKTSPQKLALQL